MISAVFVSYRTAELAERAIATFREDARRGGRDVEVVVVVNSSDPAERDALAPHSDVVLFPPRNLGYAAGLNAGIAASRGETLFLANPDLDFARGSVGALADAVAGDGLVAAGPALWGDRARTILMPLSEEPRLEELARRALAADRERSARVFRRDARRAVSRAGVAAAGRTVSVRGLSGALVAMTRRTLAAVGPFDESFPLYYEENDWQRRLLLAGGRLCFVGAAHVVHPYGQSTRREARAAAWFAESESRFFAKHFGAAGTRAIGKLAGLRPPGDDAGPPADTLRWSDPAPAAIALSPYPSYRPFGLVLVPPPERSWRLPEDFARARSGEPLWARAFARDSGAVLAESRIAAL